MDAIEQSKQATPRLRIVRLVGPWVALATVMFIALSVVTGFQSALRTGGAGTGAATATSSVEPTASTVVTGTVAVIRIDGIWLRAAADTHSEAIAAAKKGAKLQVLNRTDTWLRVKDTTGHIGWIANSSKSVQIRKK